MALRSMLFTLAISVLTLGTGWADVCSRETGSWGGYGDVTAVALDGENLLFGGSILRIADAGQPQAPPTVGSLDLRPVIGSAERIHDLAVKDGLAVVGLGAAGAAFVNVDDPARPSLLTAIYAPGADWSVRAVGVAPPMAVVASSYDLDRSRSMLARIDLNDPSTPVQIDAIDMHGEIQDLVIEDRYAFVITSSYSINGGTGIAPATLHVIDLIRWDGLDIVGFVEFPGAEPIAVDATAGRAVLLDWHGGVHLVNTSDPRFPTLVGFVDTSASGWGAVTISQTNAYIASSGGLHIVGFGNIGPPAVLAAVPDQAYEAGIAVRGDWAYPAAGVRGLEIIDIRQVNSPVSIGFTGLPHHADDVALSNHKAAVEDSSYDPQGRAHSVLRILDIDSRGSVSSHDTLIPPGPINGIAMSSNLLVMSVEIGSISTRCVIRTVDLSEPLNLGFSDEIPICPFESEAGIQIAVENNLMAVLDAARTAVHLFDLSAEDTPAELGAWPVRRSCTAIALGNKRLFTGSLSGGSTEIEVVDVSSPDNPDLEYSIRIDGGACIDLAGNQGTLAVAAFRPGKTGAADLHLIDIETATVRFRIRGVSQSGFVDLKTSGEILYVGRSNAAQSELLFVDLQERWPVLRAFPINGEPGAAFDVVGSRVAWAGGATGVHFTQVEHCATPARDAGEYGRAGYTP